MEIQPRWPITSKQQLLDALRSLAPGYRVIDSPRGVIVGNGLVTGVLVKCPGDGRVRLGWEMPSTGVKLLLVPTVLAGVVPYLLLYLIIWLSVKTHVEAMKAELGQAFSSGNPIPMTTSGAHAPSMQTLQPAVTKPARPGRILMALALVTVLASLFSFFVAYRDFDALSRYSGMSTGSRSSAYLDYFDAKRREEARNEVAMGIVGLLVAVGMLGLRHRRVRDFELAAVRS